MAALEDAQIQVSVDRLEELVLKTVQALGAEEFALVMGARFKLSTLGPLGRLVLAQPTVRAAAEILQRYNRYQSESVDVYLDSVGDGLRFIPILLNRRSRASVLMNDLFLSGYAQCFRELLGQHWRPASAWLTRPPPTDRALYDQRLGRVEFGSSFNGFLLSAQELNAEIRSHDPELAAELGKQFENLRASRAISAAPTVTALIMRLLPLGHCGVDDVARQLGVDRRTVHRRLAAEGASFTELLERARREVATEQLLSGALPLSEVTARVGFSSLSAFSRWFRHAYGIQPSEFRRRGQAA